MDIVISAECVSRSGREAQQLRNVNSLTLFIKFCTEKQCRLNRKLED